MRPFVVAAAAVLLLSLTPGPAPGQPPVLVLNYHGGSTVHQTLVDELAALASPPWIVTHVSPAEFQGLDEARLRSFDVLLIVSGGAGDPPCGTDQWGDPLDFSGLLDNPDVGRALADGRKVITTLDPDWHGASSRPERSDTRRFLANAVAWAGSASVPGYVAPIDGHYCSTWWDDPRSFLRDVVNGPGVDVEYGESNQASITEPGHPVNAGLPPVLDYCCHHGRFVGTPPGFRHIMVHPGTSRGMTAIQDEAAANTPPVIRSFVASPANEGVAVRFLVEATDPEGDSLTYTFDVDGDGAWDVSGSSPTTSHVFGDDFRGSARVRVSDGSLSAEATASVAVDNVPPVITDLEYGGAADVRLRIAGEKWHSVDIVVREAGAVLAGASVVRSPGSPDDQAVSLGTVAFDSSGGPIAVEAQYTPDDDPVNGQVWGATPAWLLLTAPDGSEARLHHTFNVRHPDTWRWSIEDLRPAIAALSLTFVATATDAGSDDLTFLWSWGDGSPGTSATHYNDGTSPDPFPSPGGTFPFLAQDAASHGFSAPGDYVVVLTVRDDDGGSASRAVTVRVR